MSFIKKEMMFDTFDECKIDEKSFRKKKGGCVLTHEFFLIFELHPILRREASL